MGSKTSTLLQETEIADISRETGFTHNQIVRLYSRFTALDKMSNGFLSREDFLRIPELAINPLGDRIVNAFFQENHDEANFRQFMRVLACFRPIKKAESAAAAQSAASMATNGSGAQGTALGTSNEFHSVRATLNSRDSKLRFAFDMYDLDQDGYISRDELLSVLQMMVGANISTEQLMSIADRTIAEADEDGDSKISFAEFCKALESCDVEQKMSIKFLN